MSRKRHEMHKRAMGGKTGEGSGNPEWEAGGQSDAAKEAEERKRGGKVKSHMHGEGEEGKHRSDRPARRARGGKVDGAGMHHSVKHHSMHHAPKDHGSHVAGRKRGGGIGANLTPLSTAARVKQVTKGETPEIGEPDGE